MKRKNEKKNGFKLGIKMLLLLLFITLAASSCENFYTSCVKETSQENSFYGWVSNGYTRMIQRNICLDMFQVCTKVYNKTLF